MLKRKKLEFEYKRYSFDICLINEDILNVQSNVYTRLDFEYVSKQIIKEGYYSKNSMTLYSPSSIKSIVYTGEDIKIILNKDDLISSSIPVEFMKYYEIKEDNIKMEELKECPFCGGYAEYESLYANYQHIYCKKCGAMSTFIQATVEKVYLQLGKN